MKKSVSIFLIFLHLTFFIGQFSFASEYTLAPGDQLEVRIIGQKDLDSKQAIAPDGTLSLPMVGRVKVEGLNLKQLDQSLTKEYSKYVQKPQPVVYLTPRPIYVIQHDLKPMP